MQERARRYFRIIAVELPNREDFLSDKAKGQPPRNADDAELLRLWDGISVFATFQQARNKANRYDLGRFIAEVLIPENSPIRVERTTRSPGHHTLWSEPDAVLRCVVRVLPL